MPIMENAETQKIPMCYMQTGYYYFKPRSIPLADLEEVSISMDELEAIKLADYSGLYNEDAAEKMKKDVILGTHPY
jgi:predicted DNA-binding protein (UPF0251 family)